MKQLQDIDASLSRRLALPPDSKQWEMARLLAHLGDGQYVFGGLTIVFLIGWLRDDAYLRQASLAVSLIILLTMLVVTLTKFAVRRQRPRPPGEFVTFEYDKYSFPSGHAARLSALAGGTFFFFPDLGWVMGGIATCVAAARVLVGVHYISDVVVGVGVGLLAAWIGVIVLSVLLFVPTF